MPAAKFVLRRLKTQPAWLAAGFWQEVFNNVFANPNAVETRLKISDCFLWLSFAVTSRDCKFSIFCMKMPVHSREADGPKQGTTCERIEKLVCVQTAGETVKIPFPKRNFQRILFEKMCIKHIFELSAAVSQAE
ncbi:MAG: hypothetical protein Q4F29_02260 [Lachnospiraceae bacterium]|nr:hypothetical protein [Lachnospiraceae bacterium]